MNVNNNKQLEILAADDGPENQVLLQLFLRDYPCQLDIVNNGEEAVRMYKRKSYDVVLMDMLMPVQDGYEAARIIRQLEKEQRRNPAHIIALTANTLEEQMQRCQRAGCNHFLHKPLSHQKLWELLDMIRCQAVQLVLLKEDVKDLIPGYINNRYLDAKQTMCFLAEQDYASIELIGHRMKGSGSGYGLDFVSRLGQELASAAALEQATIIEAVVNELTVYLKKLMIIYLGNDHQA